MSTKTTTLAEAMASAFAEIEAATKAAENPAFKRDGKATRYADLTAVIDAVKPPLIAHGLYFTQHCHPSEDGVIVETVLSHSGGESVSLGKLFMPANKRDPQGFGSALTYCRRYALQTAFGVPTEDDDGNAAVKGVANDTRPVNGNGKRDIPFPQGPAKNITELKTMGREFWRMVEGCGDGDELTALLESHAELTKQIHDALPQWWSGGDKNGEPYDGLSTVITKRQLELSVEEADANARYRESPVSAG